MSVWPCFRTHIKLVTAEGKVVSSLLVTCWQLVMQRLPSFLTQEQYQHTKELKPKFSSPPHLPTIWIFGGAKVQISTQRVGINKGVINPLYEAEKLELYPDSVFQYAIGWYSLGIFLTDIEGKLGKDLWYRTFGGNPFFARFCPLFDGPSPPFEGEFPQNFTKWSARQILQYKKYRTCHTEYTNPQVPVTYRYRPNCQ